MRVQGIMHNQVGKKMEHEMETRCVHGYMVVHWCIGFRVCLK